MVVTNYRFNRKYTNEFLISELHRFKKEFGRVPTQKDMCSKNGYISSTTYANYFGNWNAALIAAGMGVNNYIGYTREFLISELHRFVKQYEKNPTLETFGADKSYPSSTVYARYFGTWNKALIEAGLEVNNFTEYTPELLISELYRFIEENDRIPTFNDMCGNNGYPHATTYSSYFGSWTNAVKVAGIDKKDFMKTHLISELHRFVDNEGHIPSAPEMKREWGYPAKNTYARYFGTWNQALVEAELELHRPTYTEDDLLDILIDYYDTYNKTPVSSDFTGENGYPSSVTYSEKFGSWNNALKLAGLDINQIYYYTDEELLDALKNYYLEHNEVPTTYTLVNNPNYPSSRVYIARFGSFNKALSLAGLDVVHFFHRITDDDFCTICGTKSTPCWRHVENGDLICKRCATRLWRQSRPDLVQANRHRRRGYGFNPINDRKDNHHAHHLHLENNSSFVLYIPEFIHTLHNHNSEIENSMISVNALALDYWINEELYVSLYLNGGDALGTVVAEST
ncbi:MAG: hypothetical protein WC179_09930 [Candidatus Cloacimonadaceae bacterium]